MRARVAMILVAGLALASPPAAPAKSVKARLAAFTSCPDLLGFARSAATRTGADGGVTVRALDVASQPFGAPTPTSAPGKAVAPEAAPTAGALDDGSSSTTNVQEAGVDEPDIVKSDAKHAFLISGSTLLAYDVSGDVPRLLGSVTLGGYGGDLLVRGSRALVIGSGGGVAIDQVTAGKPTGIASPSIAPIFYRPQVQLTEVDISDPAAMKIARTLDVDGSYVSARLTGGTARIVLNTPPDLVAQPDDTGTTPGSAGGTTGSSGSSTASAAVAKAALGIRAFLPETVLRSRVSGHTFRRPLVGCRQVRHAVPFSGLDLLTVLSIDLDHGLFNVDRDAVMAGAQVVYASTGSLYVASQRFVRGGIETVSDVPDGMRTEIHRFDTSQAGETTYRSSGSVPGFVLNQFAMSEYKDHLRVASTEEPPWLPNGTQVGERQSYVSVLGEQDGRLQTVGRVGGLGAGERIYAVRFIGDAGYVVTFRQVDPLFALDLSKPEDPRVMGELKIAGYSAYLHPIGDDLLVGVGQDATAQGLRAGAQVSLFDVSDLKNPKRLDHHALDPASGNASSEAEWDHHAFLWWGPTALAVLPLQTYATDPAGSSFAGAVGLRIRRAGIAEVGRITHGTGADQAIVRRSFVAGSRLFTVSDRGIAAASLDKLAPLGFTAFPDQPATGGGGVIVPLSGEPATSSSP
jgi:uncharacterized secreted protein with C-terminal beta-propeller domain